MRTGVDRTPKHPNSWIIQPNVGADYPTLTHGRGIWVRDLDGREYLDAVAGVGVVSLGYGRADISDALSRQAMQLPYTHSMRFGNLPQAELGLRLTQITPEPVNWFFFCSGGSEALDSALKIVRQYWLDKGEPGRWKVIGRRPSFHGNTLAALSVGYHASRRTRYEPYLIDLPHIPAPWAFQCDRCNGRNSCDICTGAVLEEVILAEGPDTVAAFIAEPIVGAAAPGVTPVGSYYQTIREICDYYGVLFVADEVITGIGRTGRHFGLDHWSVVPDLIMMAKGIASGYAALGAVGVHESVIDVIRRGQGRIEHNFTMAGNPLACAVGVAVIDAYQREGVAANAAEVENALFAGLDVLRKRYPFVGDVRGKGLLAGIELTEPGGNSPFPRELELAGRIDRAAQANGVLVYPCSGIIDGEHGDAILLLPPLVISIEEIDEMMRRLDGALSSVAEQLT